MKSTLYRMFFVVTAGLVGTIMASGNMSTACNVDISQQPMETVMQAPPPHVMFVFDNSGSMDWEFMTPEDNGVFHDSPPSSGTKLYIFPADDYSPGTDHNDSDGYTISENQRRRWKYQWSGYNKIYYNPRANYMPWPGAAYGNADTTNPRSNPKNSSPTFNLAGEFLVMPDLSACVRLNADYRNNNNECCHYSADAVWVGNSNYSVLIDNNNYYNDPLIANFSMPDDDGVTDDWGAGHYSYDIYNNYYYNKAIDHDTWAMWSFAIPADGNYDVYVYYRTLPSRYRNVTYTIKHGNVETVVSHLANDSSQPLISHNSADGQGDTWQYIGTFNFTKTNSIIVYNAHYYAWDDSNGNGDIDNNEVYLVNFEDTDHDGVLDARKYYRFNDENGNDIIDSANELIEVADIPDSIKAVKKDQDGNIIGYMSFSEELQNFANWFSYYRRRELTAKAAVAIAMDQLNGVNVGFYTINSGLRQPVVYLNDHRNELYNKLFGIDSDGYTPLRYALKNVGRYFDADDGYTGNLGDAPWASEADGGSCQQAFAILMTDGYWNGSSPNVGNVDGNDVKPFKDSYSNTLADVARKYYKEDLADDISNAVPVNECDSNNKQHLVTYGLSFGVKGELNPSYDAYQECMLGVINGDPDAPPAPAWKDPTSNCYACPKKIDDLWHAAVNGRGTFVAAQDPEELIDALARIAANISDRAASGAAVSINSEKLTENTVLYQSSYDSTVWAGSLKAFKLNPLTGEQADELWDAQTKLNDQDWDSGRRIFTSDGSTGKPFRVVNLTDDQKSLLGNNATAVTKVLQYIRGKEISGFRHRDSKLGDLVHSAPTLVNRTVFVGGNDGMLHAFNIFTGRERFAFIPNNVFPYLKDLTDPSYDHHFFVDLTPTVSVDKTRLVGGLGAGGKGYFALNITNADSITDEDSAADMFMWEYPASVEDPDLGYSMSKVSIVKTHIGNKVAIFGNGYGSINCHAVLYILDLESGQVIKKIDTGVGGDNGLSTPVVVDTDGDFVADYVYAGDLKGNLWKFDISANSTSEWGVAYSNGDAPAPLFTVKNAGHPQPITIRPDVMRHCSSHGYVVIFATGKFFGLSDPADQSVQTVYGVWDYGDNSSEYIGEFDSSGPGTLTPSEALEGSNVTLLKQEVVTSGDDYVYITDNNATWTTEPDQSGGLSNPVNANIGWYMNLPETGERASRDIIIRNGNAIVITITPSPDKCTGGGSSTLYELHACNGGSPDTPVFDKNDDTILDDQDAEGGIPAGKKFPMIIHDPVFVRLPGKDQEFKYFSTSQGTIVRVREPAEYLGLLYWIEW